MDITNWSVIILIMAHSVGSQVVRRCRVNTCATIEQDELDGVGGSCKSWPGVRPHTHALVLPRASALLFRRSPLARSEPAWVHGSRLDSLPSRGCGRLAGIRLVVPRRRRNLLRRRESAARLASKAHTQALVSIHPSSFHFEPADLESEPHGHCVPPPMLARLPKWRIIGGHSSRIN